MSTMTADDFRRIRDVATGDIHRTQEILETELSVDEDMEAYTAWVVDMWRKEREERQAQMKVIDADTYRNAIASTIYINIDQVAQLNSAMNLGYYPQIPVGHLNGIAFRLVPNTTLLEPTKETNYKDTRHVYPSMFLGINKTVHPSQQSSSPKRGKRSRRNNQTDESTQSGDSDSKNDDTGFVFYQLGALQYTRGLKDPTTTDIEKIKAAEWYDTHYVLVVVIGASGKAEDVYILYNMRPEDEDGNRRPVDPSSWGFLPGDYSRVKRAGARIARNFLHLGPAFKWDLVNPKDFTTEEEHRATHIDDEYELVTCVRLDYPQRIIRQHVVPPKLENDDEKEQEHYHEQGYVRDYLSSYGYSDAFEHGGRSDDEYSSV